MTDIHHAAGIAQARERVLERIAAACGRAGRDPAEVRLVAVTKLVAAERIQAGVDAGLTVLGENRVQEAAAKIPQVRGASWHLLGPLQSNKARKAVELFDVIETVDSVALAERIDRLAGELRRPSLPVLVEVNVDRDPAKAGFDPGELERSIDRLSDLAGLDLRGLMTVGRQVENPEAARRTFQALADLSRRLSARSRLGPELSMGMTDDFEVAIEEGATIVRIGRALFGERPHAHDH